MTQSRVEREGRAEDGSKAFSMSDGGMGRALLEAQGVEKQVSRGRIHTLHCTT